MLLLSDGVAVRKGTEKPNERTTADLLTHATQKAQV
jgi:hypothetical protein